MTQETILLEVKHKKGWIPALIRYITDSKWDHVALYDPNKGLVYENDLTTGANVFDYSWLNSPEGDREWEVNPISLHRVVPQEQLQKFANEKYSIIHNIKTLMSRVPVLKKLVKPKKGRSNCVGYVARILELNEEAEFVYPKELKWYTNGSRKSI